MVKLQVLYGHPKDPAAFEAYYRDPHTPIAVKVPGLRRFEASKVVGAPGGAQPAFYRTADLYFDNMDALQVLSMLKLDDDTRSIPVLTYTAGYETQDEEPEEDDDPEAAAMSIFSPAPGVRMN